MAAAVRHTALLAVRIAAIAVFTLLFASTASALSIQAPAGGAPITLPADRLLCGNVPDGWTADTARKHLTPPPVGARVGQTTEVTLASTVAGCTNGNGDPATLIVTGPLPVIDVQSVTLSVDAGRLEVHGDGLEGMLVSWRSDVRAGADRCLNVGKDKGRDVCALDVDRKLPADPRAIVLRWAPQGGRADADAVTYDQSGAALADEQMKLPVAKILVSRVFGDNNTVDVSSGEGRVHLVHPEAVSSVDCGTSRCDIAESGFVVRGVPATTTTLNVRLRLLPRVFLTRGDVQDPVATGTLSVLRCPLALLSGEPLRGVDNLSVLVRLDPTCAKDPSGIKWTVLGEPVEAQRVETLPDGVYVLLRVGRISGDRLTLVATRQDDGSVLAVSSEKTWEAPPLRTSLTLPGFGDIDFIPKNRPAVLTVSPVLRTGRLIPVSVPGAYVVKEQKDGFHIRGEPTSGGYTSLRFAYRPNNLPKAFADTDFATLVDPVQRPIREANVPAPLSASSVTDKPIIDLMCAIEPGKLIIIKPGTSPHIPFTERDSCRLTIHRDRIPEEDGEQRVDIDVSVTSLSGERGEAKLSNHLVLRHAPTHDVIWIRGAKEQFDHINVRVTHVIDESQYMTPGGRAEIPSSQWTVVTENTNFKFYLTAAIPTSLYRFSKDPQDLGSGPLALNFGVLSRLTWLDNEGHEGLVGLETGVMGMGLATDKDRQLALVAGLGIGVPLGNVNQPTQASVNIHAWFAYTVGNRTAIEYDPVTNVPLATVKLNPWGFVFGPSITIGNVGTFL
ncbi:MAG TPA: hypothetical protein VHC69_05740 [Polyangiaceae bacterium]|nr:hypothetical protein [Polyangiaceae bacterium]